MKRIFFSAISLFAALVMLCSCNTQKAIRHTTSTSTASQQTSATSQESADTTASSVKSLLPLEDYGLDDVTVNFDEQTNADFQDFISDIDTKYKGSEVFNFSKALELHGKMNIKPVKSGSIIKDGKVNSDKLYEAVVKNNKEFLSKDVTNKYNEIDSVKLKNVVGIISEQINAQLKENKDIDINILDSNLKNLKIFDSVIFGNGMVENEDSKLCLSLINIDSLQKQNPDVNMLERVVRHESNHLIQVGYPKSGEFQYNMGFCYSYEDLEINSLYWIWLTEGSAEKLTLEKADSEPYNYKNQVMAIEALTLSKIADKNSGTTDIENLTLQKDINKLFEYFNADTEAKKNEILNMMFSLEIILNDNKDIQNHYGYDLKELSNYQSELKNSVCETLSKIFYSSLSEALVNRDCEIADIYLLIRIFESEMCRITDYDNTMKVSQTAEFVSGYGNIQNEFFKKLASVTDMTEQYIKDSFCAYSDSFCDSAKYKDEDSFDIDVNISWLNDGKNEFLEHISKSRVNHIAANINN